MLRTTGLSILDSSTVDLTDNAAVIDYVGSSSLSALTQSIAGARHGGAWDKSGLTTTMGDAQHFALGIAESSHLFGMFPAAFLGEQVDSTAVLVRYTRYGDADLNGVINFDDYVRTDNGFNNHLSGWTDGDFDYNGQVNFDDYVLIDLNFNQQRGSLRRAIAFIDGSDPALDGMDEPPLRMIARHFEEFGDTYAQHFLAAAVPEPAAASLVPLLAPTVMARRVRRCAGAGGNGVATPRRPRS